MPNVVGMNEEDSTNALLNVGLMWTWNPPEVGESLASVNEWTIMGQTPGAGALVEVGSEVLLTARRSARAAPTPSASPTPDAPAFTAEELAYLDALRTAGRTSFPAGEDVAVRSAHDYCTNLTTYYGSDPMTAVSALIENAIVRDEAAIATLCPEFAQALAAAKTGFHDGTHRVVDSPQAMNEIKAGTYRTIVPSGATGIHDCYWERTTGGGNTIANDFVTFAPSGVTVTIRSGEGFVSEGCGSWLPA